LVAQKVVLLVDCLVDWWESFSVDGKAVMLVLDLVVQKVVWLGHKMVYLMVAETVASSVDWSGIYLDDLSVVLMVVL